MQYQLLKLAHRRGSKPPAAIKPDQGRTGRATQIDYQHDCGLAVDMTGRLRKKLDELIDRIENAHFNRNDREFAKAVNAAREVLGQMWLRAEHGD